MSALDLAQLRALHAEYKASRNRHEAACFAMPLVDAIPALLDAAEERDSLSKALCDLSDGALELERELATVRERIPSIQRVVQYAIIHPEWEAFRDEITHIATWADEFKRVQP